MDFEQLGQSSGMDLYRHLISHVREKTEVAGRGDGVSIGDTVVLARHLIQQFQGSGRLLEICTAAYNPADLTMSHAVNVACLACKMAVDMKLSARDVEDTLVAGVLHDIGFGRYPRAYARGTGDQNPKSNRSLS